MTIVGLWVGAYVLVLVLIANEIVRKRRRRRKEKATMDRDMRRQ